MILKLLYLWRRGRKFPARLIGCSLAIINYVEVDTVSMTGHPMTRNEMRKHFLLNGSTSIWALIRALWPNFANKLLENLYGATNKHQRLTLFQNLANDMEPHVKATSTPVLHDLGIFGAKLLMCYALLVGLLLPQVSSVLPKAKMESIAWILTSLETRGAVYVLLKQQGDPKTTALIADYLERRGNINASLVAWEAATEMLKEQEKPLSRSAIQRHVERLKIHSKSAL